MSSILVVTWDAGGNVAPALGIAAELHARGHRVRVMGHAALAPSVESRSLRFQGYRHSRGWSPGERVSNRRAELDYLAMCTDRGTGRDVLASVRAEPVDLAVVDCMLLGALSAASRSGLPHVALVHTLYAYMRESFGRGFVDALAALKLMRPRRLWDRAGRALVTTAPSLEPLPALPPNARLVGPVIPPCVPSTLPGPVLVSLSSLYYPGQVQTLQSIMDGVADLPVPVILTTGKSVRPDEIRAPSNVEIHGYLPHAGVMPRVSLVVGHGGHSTATQALAHDLPMVVLPMFDRSDQALVGRAIARAGAGEVLHRTAAPAEIRAAIVRMLADGPHRAAAARLGAEIRSTPGAAGAADEIESLL